MAPSDPSKLNLIPLGRRGQDAEERRLQSGGQGSDTSPQPPAVSEMVNANVHLNPSVLSSSARNKLAAQSLRERLRKGKLGGDLENRGKVEVEGINVKGFGMIASEEPVSKVAKVEPNTRDLVMAEEQEKAKV